MKKDDRATEETYGMPDDKKVDPRKVEAYREGQAYRHRGQGK
jgi:hypothetical protein